MALAAVALTAAAGCRGRATDAIAVVPKGTSHQYWKAVHAGAARAAAALGVEIIWKGPLREDDRENQIQVVESFVNMRVRGIVVAPLDERALVPALDDAVRRRIPVVVIDSGLASDEIVSFVATDNRLGGRRAGEHLARRLGGKGRVMMLRYAEGSASTAERERGFLEAVAAHRGIEIASAQQYGGVTSEAALEASENLLAAHRAPDGGVSVQGIFCSTEPTTFGMLRALEEAGLAGKVTLVGFDSSPKLVEALARGHLDATVVQDPVRMGAAGVEAMVAHLRGQPVARRIDTGVTLVTRESMNEPLAKALLAPEVGRSRP